MVLSRGYSVRPTGVEEFLDGARISNTGHVFQVPRSALYQQPAIKILRRHDAYTSIRPLFCVNYHGCPVSIVISHRSAPPFRNSEYKMVKGLLFATRGAHSAAARYLRSVENSPSRWTMKTINPLPKRRGEFPVSLKRNLLRTARVYVLARANDRVLVTTCTTRCLKVLRRCAALVNFLRALEICSGRFLGNTHAHREFRQYLFFNELGLFLASLVDDENRCVTETAMISRGNVDRNFEPVLGIFGGRKGKENLLR